MKIYFRIEAVSRLLKRSDFQSPSLTLAIRIANAEHGGIQPSSLETINVVRLLERQKGWPEWSM